MFCSHQGWIKVEIASVEKETLRTFIYNIYCRFNNQIYLFVVIWNVTIKFRESIEYPGSCVKDYRESQRCLVLFISISQSVFIRIYYKYMRANELGIYTLSEWWNYEAEIWSRLVLTLYVLSRNKVQNPNFCNFV